MEKGFPGHGGINKLILAWVILFSFVNSSKAWLSDLSFSVQLNPPVNLSAEVKKQVYKNPSVLFNWSPPPEADVKSGWLTLNYELRLKPEDGEVWEVRNILDFGSHVFCF